MFLHSDLSSNPGPASFDRLKNAPDNASVRSFVNATQKLSPDLQISKDEAKRFSAATGAGGGGVMPPAIVAFWTDVLTARTKSFVSGGMAAQAPYDHAGPSVRASEEVNGLLRDQGKIRQQFSGLLGATAIGRGAKFVPRERRACSRVRFAARDQPAETRAAADPKNESCQVNHSAP